MRFKTKIVILLVAVLLTVLSFSVVTAYVYSGMLGPTKYNEFEFVTSNSKGEEKKTLMDCC